MNDRPTPETDLEHLQFKMGGFTLDFCRKLERERDEAIRQRDETNELSKFSCNFNYEQKLKAERERDEARNECKALWAMVGAEKKKAYNALRERDEARERIDRYREINDLVPISWDQ